MSRYTCTSRGECEDDEYGHYATEEECESKCREGWEHRDVEFIRYTYEIDKAIQDLAPSDKAYVVRLLTGIVVPREQAHNILLAIEAGDWRTLVSMNPMFIEWVRAQYTDPLTMDLLLTPVETEELYTALQGGGSSADISRILTRFLTRHAFPIDLLQNGDYIGFVSSNRRESTGGFWINGKVIHDDTYRGERVPQNPMDREWYIAHAN